MPELPEVECVRRGLSEALKGARIRKVALRRGDLRIPLPKNLPQALAGRHIKSIDRRAKYLLWRFDLDDVLIVHLGMSGRFLIENKPPAHYAKHDHVVFEFEDGRVAVFNDARRFGLMTLAKEKTLKSHPLFAHLGPEPLEKEFSPEYLKAALARRKGPIKPVLMDQALVVGVGNIYASEALFLAGVDPRKPANKAASRSKEMVAAIRSVLKAAIGSGGSSLKDFLHITGKTGDFQHRFQVYDQKGEPCRNCSKPLVQIRQAGRSSFFCKHCQK